jgi:hypothetical protein
MENKATDSNNLQNIEIYLQQLGLDRQPTKEELKNAVVGATKDRATIYYFIWKTIQRLHPEIDADEIMREASAAAGAYKGEKWGKIDTAQQALKAFSSKNGCLAFEQAFIRLEDECAEKVFYRCPHMEALQELGCTAGEMKNFCQNMLSYGDYGNFSPHSSVHMEFLEQISNGDPVCRMRIQRMSEDFEENSNVDSCQY